MASQDSEGAFSEKHSLVFGDFILGFKNSSSRKGVWRWPPRGCRLQAPSPQPGETWAAAMRKAAAAGRAGESALPRTEKPGETTKAESGFSDEATEAQGGKQPASGHTVDQSTAGTGIHIPASFLQKQAASGTQT